jgi:hypothetical protein
MPFESAMRKPAKQDALGALTPLKLRLLGELCIFPPEGATSCVARHTKVTGLASRLVMSGAISPKWHNLGL